ncbi:MAG: hypothetical protein ABJE47_21605 [bacterium]
MTVHAELAPRDGVLQEEYQRLLGYPRERVLDGRASELAQMARDWYRANGRPWTYARPASRLELTAGTLVIDGVAFNCAKLTATLRAANAHNVVLVAASAGPELEEEAQRRWQDEKPDEYFFLEVYGSAVVEQLVAAAGARLCAEADAQNMAVLPHDSPGYPEWTISEQSMLLELVKQPGSAVLPGPMAVLESGMLRPKKSLLAVFGLTHDAERVRRLTDMVPCERCALPRCQYRRVGYARSKARSSVPI